MPYSAQAGQRYQQINGTGWPVTTYGYRMRGDAPPPACWPTASPGPVAPTLAGPLFEGTSTVHLPSATRDVSLRVFRSPFAAGDSLGLFSPTLSSPLQPTLAIVPAPPLDPHVGLYQTNAWGSVISPEGVFITPFTWPSEVFVPHLPYAVHADSRAVVGMGLYPGAKVEVLVGGVVVGQGWTQEETSLSLPLSGALNPGVQVKIRQTIGGTTQTSAGRVVQSGSRPLQIPTVPWPVEVGAYAVPVSGVTPGSLVKVTDASGNVLGSAAFGEPYGYVPVCALPPTFRVVVERGPAGSPTTAQTALLTARPAPAANVPHVVSIDTLNGIASGSGSRWFKQFAPEMNTNSLLFVVHGETDDASFSCEQMACGVLDYHFLENLGQCFYYSGGTYDSNSFLGFDYLGENLAESGTYVVSVPAAYEGSPETIAPPFELFVRDFLSEHPDLADLPIFLSGLSNGGEAALAVTPTLAADFDVRGSFLMAPNLTRSASWQYPVDHQIPVYILSGDEDYFYNYITYPNNLRTFSTINTLRNNSTVALIPGGSHAAFNTCWEGDSRGDDLRIPVAEQRDLTVALARRFIQDQLAPPTLDRVVGRLTPANLPPGAWSRRPRVAWKAGERLVIENFGDADPFIPLTANNLSGLNSLGLVNDTQPAQGPTTGTLTEAAVADTLQHPLNRTGRLDWHIDSFSWRSRTGDLDATEWNFLTLDTFHASSLLNRDHLPTDLLVLLRDTSGRTATVRLGIDNEVDAPWVRDSSAEQTPPVLRPRPALETHAIPLDAFLAENPALDLQHLERILLRSVLPTTGSVHLDNLELRR